MRIIIASVLSAIALFFFGFVWWALLMDSVKPAQAITDETVIQKLDETFSESDLYIYPDGEPPTEGSMAFVYYVAETPDMMKTMGLGFVHMLVISIFVSTFVAFMPCQSFAGRFGLVLFLGLFVAIWADIGNMIWWHHPIKWMLFHFAYDFLSWTIAGVIIAAIVRGREAVKE